MENFTPCNLSKFWFIPLSYLRFYTVKIHEDLKPKIFKLQGRNPKKNILQGVKPKMTYIKGVKHY